MINLFDHILFNHNDSKSDRIIVTVFGLLYGWWGYDFLFWMDSLEHIIKALMGIATVAIGSVTSKMVIKYYELHLEDKIFKKKKNGKEKNDNQRAA